MMKSIIYLFFGFLQIISETFLVTGSVIDIKIIPETAYMVALEGAEIKLDCIVEFKETTDVNVNFYKDGVMIPVGTHYGYNVIVSQTFIASLDLYRTTTTLIKNVTDADDRGSYECRVQIATEDGTYMNRIEVVTFTASGVDRELQEDDGETAEFPCIINIKAAKVVVEHTIFWERNGTRLADDDKYKITNTTLQISKPTREDLGAYQCVVVMFPTSMVEKQTVRINPFFLKASPKIESHDSDKNMVLGDNLELKCKVSGYPTPIVSWFKDEKEIKTTSRIHILENEGAMGKLMIHSLEDEDEGIYKCLAKNEVVPFNADAKMTVRVEGQYVIDLTIVPEKTYMLTLERAELRLDCIVHFKGTPYVKAIFYKDGTMLPVGTFGGYHVTVNETFIASLKLYRTTTTLIKNVTDASDRGKYQCRAQKATGEGMYSSIEVITFTGVLIDCYTTTPDKYSGHQQTTKTGKPCIRWDSPVNNYTDSQFPDATVSDAANFCRAVGSNYLWCWTSNALLQWSTCGIKKCDGNGLSKCGTLKIQRPALLGRIVNFTFTPDSYDPNAILEWQYAREEVSWYTLPLTYKYRQFYENNAYRMVLSDSVRGIDEVHYRIHYYNESMHCWMEAGKIKLIDPNNPCGFVLLRNELILEYENVYLEYYPYGDVFLNPEKFVRRWTYTINDNTSYIELKTGFVTEEYIKNRMYVLTIFKTNRCMPGNYGVYCGKEAGFTNNVSVIMRAPSGGTESTEGTTPHEATVSKGKNEESDGIGAMLGYVCAALAVGTITGVICTWLVLHRQGQIKDSREQSQTQPTVCQETEFTGATSTLNSYEQLQNRTDIGHRDDYDSLDANSRPAPNSQSEYECLEQGEEISFYTDLNQRR